MKDFIIGKITEAKTVETKTGTTATAIRLEIEGRYDPETKTRPKEAKTVWYFNKENVPVAEWALKAGEKNVGKTVLLTANEYEGKLQGDDIPGSWKLITIPAVLRSFETEEEANAAFDAFDGALCAVKEAGLLPEEYGVDTSKSASVKDAIALLGTIEDDKAKAAKQAAQKLLTYERNAFIGTVIAVYDNPDKDSVNVNVSIPGMKDGEEDKRGTFVFGDKLRAQILKVFTRENEEGVLETVKNKDGKNPRAVLFGGSAREYNGKLYFNGTGFRKIW